MVSRRGTAAAAPNPGNQPRTQQDLEDAVDEAYDHGKHRIIMTPKTGVRPEDSGYGGLAEGYSLVADAVMRRADERSLGITGEHNIHRMDYILAQNNRNPDFATLFTLTERAAATRRR